MNKIVTSVLLLIAQTMSAQFITLSSLQESISASGSASLDQYGTSNYMFNGVSGTVGGSVTVINPNPDKFGLRNTTASFGSSAGLTTATFENEILSSVSVFAQGGGTI